MEKAALKPVIEALIFAADHPLSFDRLVGVLEGESREDVRAALKELTEDYRGRGGGIVIEEVAGGFQMRTLPEHAPWIKRLFKVGMQRVSKAALETLAIVAYRQPVTRAGLEEIRGVDSAGVLRTLLERRLVRIVGRQDAPGRPVVYGTTKEFLETFSLSDLSSLPTLKEIQTLEGESMGDTFAVMEETVRESERETSEDNSSRGDSVKAQGRGDDTSGQGSG